MPSLTSLKKTGGITFTGVVAMTPNRVIGKDGGMPWHLPEDLKTFRALTTGHPVLMGRKTFDSIGKPLPQRQNIVLTRDPSWQAADVTPIQNLEALFSLPLMNREVCIIGGAALYSLCLPELDVLWVSRIHQEYEGDTSFPEFEHFFSDRKLEKQFEAFDLWKYTK